MKMDLAFVFKRCQTNCFSGLAISYGCHDAMQHKSENFTWVFQVLNLGCYNSTLLTGISSRDSKSRKEGEGYDGLQDLLASGGFLLEEVDQGIVEIFIGYTSRSPSTYTIGKEGNLTGRMDLGEYTTTEYLLIEY